jgi:ketosteroid isomerase-like protein
MFQKRLMEQFGRAWEQGQAEVIADVFTAEAQFLPEPFTRSLGGRKAIVDYWKDIPKEQAEITFRFGEIFVAGPWFSTEFKCTFRRRRTGELMDVRGAIFCQTEKEKVSEMRVYWHRAHRRGV